MNSTYKHNRHDGEHHDGTALANGLVGLLHRLPCLYDPGLLLLQLKQILYLGRTPQLEVIHTDTNALDSES